MICCTENFAKQFKTLIISLFPWGKKHTGNPRTYRRQKPVLYLSVNAQALDNNGLIHEYLKQKNIPLALWFVDNVWNILSRFSQAWWKECAIFLTDFSFASQLRKEGAKKLFPLPLASHSLQAPYADLPKIPLFFVGNSSFANKNAYFSGCKLEHDFEQNIYRTIQKNFSSKKNCRIFTAFGKPCFLKKRYGKTKIAGQ